MVLFNARRRFLKIGVALVTAIACADALIIDMERDASLAAFQTAANNLTRGMTAQTARSLHAVDQALLDTQAGLAAGATRATLALLGERQLRLPGVSSLAVADATGRVVASSLGATAAGADVATRDYFRHFATATDQAAFVAAPFRDGTGWNTVIARRVADAQGHFAGVVLAQLSLSDLTDFYRVAMPPRRTVTVTRRDGTVLVQFPQHQDRTGDNVRSAAWSALVAAGGGTRQGAALIGNGQVVAAVRLVPGLPLVIETSIGQDEALAGWYWQSLWMLLGGVAASIAVAALLRLFAGQVRRLQASETSLAIRNEQVEAARRQLDVAFTNISQGLCFFDGAQRLIVCNRRYLEIYSLPPAAIYPGMAFAEIVDHFTAAGGAVGFTRNEFLMAREAAARAGEAYYSVVELASGRTVAIQQQPMPDGGWVATHEDITERRRAEERITFLARHDVLTGLANRSLLQERIGQAIVAAARGGQFAVLFLDLDRFKAVNDTLGHGVGDELLRAVAARLEQAVRECDTVARLGGDEFVILQAGLRTPDDAAYLAARIIRVIAAPYTIGAHEVVIGVSVGVDVSGPERASPETMLKNADLALYMSKAEGRGTFRFFEPEMDAKVQNRHALEHDLRAALAENQFELYYQPTVDARTGDVGSFEALIRWNHPTRGLVSPADFIPLAEESRLIVPIGEWALRTACAQAATWPAHIRVAVNLSPVQFARGNLVQVVRDALDSSGLAAERLELEITESVLLKNNERTLATLHELRACGIRIAMDDFGVGYSSMSYLLAFPFDKVKIDRTFIKDLTTREDAVSVVRAIVGLCRDLGIRTTAEGVETEEQRDILLREACPDVQGYLFSRPKPVIHLPDMIGCGQRLGSASDDRGVAGRELSLVAD